MSHSTIIPAERIERRILLLRGQKVMLDFQLAELYEVETRTLNQAVRRNAERFPEDFVFQLAEAETEQVMRSQIVTASPLHSSQTGMSLPENGQKTKNTTSDMRSQSVIASEKRNIRFRPYAFTEQGVAMLSSVLRGPRAVQVNIAIMRTFVQLRQMLSSNDELARKLASLESKYDQQFKVVFDAIRELMKPPTAAQKREIGFHTTMPARPPKARGKSLVGNRKP
jgi:ORF6N domain